MYLLRVEHDFKLGRACLPLSSNTSESVDSKPVGNQPAQCEGESILHRGLFIRLQGEATGTE